MTSPSESVNNTSNFAAAAADQSPQQISTFVFLDLETSNLESYDKPKIIELCVVAVHRNVLVTDVSQTDITGSQQQQSLPRVLDKITLCFNPNKSVGSRTFELTGLDNLNIAESAKKIFDEDAVKLLQLFFRRQEQPVCLVAHNGNRFDFRLLRTELRKLEQNLSDNILCADSLIGIYETDLEVILDHGSVENNDHVTPPKRSRLNKSETSRTTPSKYKRVVDSPLSYSLANVYKRTFSEKSSFEAHTAEGDVMSLIQICQARGKRMCQWMDRKAVPFNDIELYYVPSPTRRSKRSLQY